MLLALAWSGPVRAGIKDQSASGFTVENPQ